MQRKFGHNRPRFGGDVVATVNVLASTERGPLGRTAMVAESPNFEEPKNRLLFLKAYVIDNIRSK